MADFPSIPFNSLNLNSNTPTIITRSISGLENRQQVGTQHWSFSARFSALTDADRRTIMGFLISKRGPFSNFTIDLPAPFKDSTGTYTPNITNLTGAAGATSVSATGVSNTALILRAGDFVYFSNHAKVYMVTANATSVGTNVTINLFPALRTGVAGSSLIHKNVVMQVRCTNDDFGFSSDPTLYSDIDMDFIEVIN
jgi:hypothetical protein